MASTTTSGPQHQETPQGTATPGAKGDAGVAPGSRTIRAPRGEAALKRVCQTWQAEAAMRMLMNNLDPAVAERPEDLVVYGGRGKAARSWAAFDAIVESLKKLAPDETLLVQSGKPVGIVRTHADSPRVLLANSNLVPHWATQKHFDELEAKGLMMFGQMTAGSWIYIGTQGILQGTYETFAECGKTHFAAGGGGGTLKGKLCVTAGCGGMGGAQPLAITLSGGTCLIADTDITRLRRRRDDRYLDEVIEVGPTRDFTTASTEGTEKRRELNTSSLPSSVPSVPSVVNTLIDRAIDRAVDLAKLGEARSVGVCCNAIELLERLIARDIHVDVLTDQTSAHDPLVGYVPIEFTHDQAAIERRRDPANYQRLSLASMARHVRAMLELQRRGAKTFDYGNNIRQRALDQGVKDAFVFPGFVPAYIRPQFCLGRGPFRWCALSGDPRDIFVTDHELLKLFPIQRRQEAQGTRHQGTAGGAGDLADEYTRRLHDWILGCHANPDALLAGDFDRCKPRFEFQGLPARICWLGLGQRDKAGLLFNRLVAEGKVKAPIVIGRDHLDCGSVASPNRETEAMKDGTDAVSDWAILNAMVNIASGASWVSFHHGGGVGIGFSQHAGQVIVADGTPDAARRLERVLTNDPMMGVLRHTDAGYEDAAACAKRQNVRIPMGL